MENKPLDGRRVFLTQELWEYIRKEAENNKTTPSIFIHKVLAQLADTDQLKTK